MGWDRGGEPKRVYHVLVAQFSAECSQKFRHYYGCHINANQGWPLSNFKLILERRDGEVCIPVPSKYLTLFFVAGLVIGWAVDIR